LSESNAIAYYVANEQLRGKSDLERAQVLQWLSFAESEILPYASSWVFPLLGFMPYNKNTLERAKEDTERSLNVLNSVLLNSTYLVGERISLADIVVFANLLSLYKYVLEPTVRNQFGNLNRWFNTVLHQPQVSKIVSNFQLADKAIEFDPKRYAEIQAKTGGGAAKAQKKDQQQQQQQPKKEKKEKKPAVKKEAEPAEELDASDMALAAEPKSKDPFAELPPGTFNYDDFKRVYSNEDTPISTKYFWEKFDPSTNSIWFGEYKYNDELTKVFMSSNLIGGMFQRLDKMRKQSFASVCLFGEDNNSTISGIWVWRGQELAFKMSPDWQIDYDCYAWKKLDPSSEETKKLVNNYLAWEGTDSNGRKFNQGKIFK